MAQSKPRKKHKISPHGAIGLGGKIAAAIDKIGMDRAILRGGRTEFMRKIAERLKTKSAWNPYLAGPPDVRGHIEKANRDYQARRRAKRPMGGTGRSF